MGSNAHQEHAFEELLRRLLPEFETHRQGASEEEIEAIQNRAGLPLPEFYLWFLSTMGRSMGPASFGRIDFRVRTILNAPFPEGAGGSLVMLGYQDDPMVHYHCYDLAYPARGDARIVVVDQEGELLGSTFETLREMLAFSELLKAQGSKGGAQCEGWMTVAGPHVVPAITPVMHALGFRTPIPTGPCCGLFEREDALLLCNTRDPSAPLGVDYFSLAAEDDQALEMILKRIASESEVSIKLAR